MRDNMFNTMKWRYKELILLLILTLVIVPIFIEMLLQDVLYQLFSNSLYSGTLTGFIMSIIFMLGVYLIALRPHRLSWDVIGVCAFPKTYLKSIAFWLIVLIGASILVVILIDLLQIGVDNSKTDALTKNINWFTFSIGFISAAIVSPLYEEIFYRGFLYKWFRVKWGVTSGILLSSLIFTVVHIPTYNTLPVNFISGIIFAWTYEKSKSIWPGVIIHGVFNGIAVILTALG